MLHLQVFSFVDIAQSEVITFARGALLITANAALFNERQLQQRTMTLSFPNGRIMVFSTVTTGLQHACIIRESNSRDEIVRNCH